MRTTLNIDDELLAEIEYRGVKATTSAVYLAELLESGNPALEGVFFPLTSLRSCDRPSVEQPECPFIERYRQEYGSEPDFFAAHGYDAMQVAIKALVDARSVDVSELRRYMRIGLREFDGVTGTIAFDERGDVQKFPRVYVVEEGNLIDYEAEVEKRRRELLERLRELERRQRQKALGGS